jgi:transposase
LSASQTPIACAFDHETGAGPHIFHLLLVPTTEATQIIRASRVLRYKEKRGTKVHGEDGDAEAGDRSPQHRARLRIRPLARIVERTFAWLHHFKRLLVRYDRRYEIHEALLAPGCCLVRFRRLRRCS